MEVLFSALLLLLAFAVEFGLMEDTAVFGGTFVSSNSAGFSNDLARFGGLPGPRFFGGDNDADADADAGGLPGPRLVPVIEDDDPFDDAEPLLLCGFFLPLTPFAIFFFSDDVSGDDDVEESDDAEYGVPSSLAM